LAALLKDRVIGFAKEAFALVPKANMPVVM